MNNSRNFTNDISNKNSFISLKNEINEKIKETLFDEKSLFLSSSFNYFCNNYKSTELAKEGKNISNLLDNISTLNEEEIIENNSIGPSTESKKKLSESEDEKSSSFGSKFTKISQVEENKKKININILKNSDLLNLLDISNENKVGVNNENYNNDEELKTEKIKCKINEIENNIKNYGNIGVKNNYLRKMVCLKLYKALNFALKNLNLKENEIKNICLYIETQGRIIDNSMTSKYKEFIENIYKKYLMKNNSD